MATGTTLTIATRRDKRYQDAVVATDAGTPALGSPVFIYDDAETQSSLLNALDKARAYVVANVTKKV